MSIAIDPGIVGPAYQAPMTLQDAENAINWYIEVAQVDGAKEPVALLGTPGLNPILTTQTGPVRGFWVLPGGLTALAVTGDTLYLVTQTVPATQTSIAQFSVASIGQLLTNSGPVCIRDNGVQVVANGGYALIVDGTYGYFYRIAGAGTITFPGSVANLSTTISLPGSLPSGLILSTLATLTDTSGFIPANTYIASIDYNTPSITMSAAATNSSLSDSITLNIPQFGLINDPGFPVNPQRLAFLEGWLVCNSGGSRNFQTSGPIAYQMTWPPSFFALKDSSTDNLITLFENNREIWLVGERTAEVWYNAGGTNFPLARIPGVGPQIGCGALNSITRLGMDLYWLAKNEQGENIVVRTAQYGWERVSNHAIEHALSSYPIISDAIAYGYEDEGHGFYVLTLPTADATWVYDVTASMLLGKPCWHQRASFDPNVGVYHRHRGNCYMNFSDLRLVGDYTTGQIHQMSRQFYTDAGAPLRAQRRAKHLWKKADRTRVMQSSFQIEFTPGVGLQTGQGSNPQAMLRWSNDGGFTWSQEHWRTIGPAGQTKNRAKWNRLGYARDRVYEVNFSDPTPRDIIGATLFLEPEDAN